MKIVTVCSTKGGVGKTTISANISGYAAHLGIKTLLIDADIQPSLSSYFSIPHLAEAGLQKLITTGSTQGCISKTKYKNLDLIVSDDPEGKLASLILHAADGRMRIKAALDKLTNYDLVIIDTQGAAGPLQDVAALAATTLLSPVPPEILSAKEFHRGMLSLLERMKPMAMYGLSIAPLFVLPYRVDHTNDAKSILNTVRHSFSKVGGISVMETIVSAAVAYRKAATEQAPVHIIDRATAIYRVKMDLEEQVSDFSERQFLARLKERGYTALDRKILRLMLYAVAALQPYIPLALSSGIGRDKVQRIRKLDQAGLAAWKNLGQPEETYQSAIFTPALASTDDDEAWDFDGLYFAIRQRMIEISKLDFNVVEVELINNLEIAQNKTTTLEPPLPSLVTLDSQIDTNNTTPSTTSDNSASLPTPKLVTTTQTNNPDTTSTISTVQPTQALVQPPTALYEDDSRPSSPPSTSNIDTLNQKQRRMAECAIHLASLIHRQDIIQPIQAGYGFTLTCIPPFENDPDQSVEAQGWRSWLIWHLISLSHLTDPAFHSLLSIHATPHTSLVHYFGNGDDLEILLHSEDKTAYRLPFTNDRQGEHWIQLPAASLTSYIDTISLHNDITLFAVEHNLTLTSVINASVFQNSWLSRF